MPQILMKCALLKTPKGDRFLAFFDTEGRIKNEEDVALFLDNQKRINPSPLTLSFRIGDQWELRGPENLLKVQRELKVDMGSLRNVPLETRDAATSPDTDTSPATTTTPDTSTTPSTGTSKP